MCKPKSPDFILLLLKACITCKNKKEHNNSYMVSFVFAETTVLFEVDDAVLPLRIKVGDI